MIYAREARLVKEQRTRLLIQVMLPQFPKEKELNVELLQPGAIRQDELWQVPLRLLPPAQMLVLILSKESSAQYAAWNRLPCLVPASRGPRGLAEPGDPALLPAGPARGRRRSRSSRPIP